MDGIELLVFIVKRGMGDDLVKLCNDEDISFDLILHGRGTVNSDMLDKLDLGDTERDIALLSVEKKRAEELLYRLSDEVGLERPGCGAAFMLPFSALASQFMSYELFAGRMPKESEGRKRR